MKTLLVILVSTSLILSTPLASAGNRHGGHGGHGGYYGHGGHGYYHGHHRHRRNNDEVGYLIGGLLLGGLVTHAYHRSQQQRVYAAPVERVYAERAYAVPTAGQRLVRDSRGGCYTSEFDSSGTEYRTPVDPALCNW